MAEVQSPQEQEDQAMEELNAFVESLPDASAVKEEKSEKPVEPVPEQAVVFDESPEEFCPAPTVVPRKGKGKGRGKNGCKDHGNEEVADTASQAPTEASSKRTKMGVGQKKPSKTHTRLCKGCNLYYVPGDMGSKSSMCHSCKYAMDTISRLATNAGNQKWATDVRADPSSLQKVIVKYKEMVGADSGARRKIPKNTMIQSLQQVSAKSRVLFDSTMLMMSEDKYMSHSATEEGGRMSKAAAVAQWKAWEEQIDNGCAPDDLIWDRKKGYLRIAVATEDTVHFQNVSWIRPISFF